MQDYVVTYGVGETCQIITDLTFSSEISFSENIAASGTMSFDDNSAFIIKYFVNDELLASTPSASVIHTINCLFPRSTFSIGENIFKLEMYRSTGELICTIEKTAYLSYYNFFTAYQGLAEPKKDLSVTLSDDRKVYLGGYQMDKSRILSDLTIELTTDINCTVRISPIFEENWNAGSKQLPSKTEQIYVEEELSAGSNSVSLIPILLSSQPIYGLVIYAPPGAAAKINLFFNRLSQTYYKVYLARPSIVYYDNLVVSWEDIYIEAVDSFQKFELLRDGAVIFTTTDYNTRRYTDTNLTLGSTYLYQLAVYLEVPENVVWDFIYAVRDLWQWRTPGAGEDPNTPRLQFETGDYVDYGNKPIRVDADYTSLILDPGLQYVAGDGISIVSPMGQNLFNEFLAQAELDFTDRVGISKLLIEANMDTSLVSLVESATKEKAMGDGYLFRFKMRKRTRGIDFA